MTSELLELFKSIRRPSGKHDTYFPVYEELFSPYKGKNITFVEIGILGGGSLEVWKEFFGPKARVIGIDLNPAMRDELVAEGYEVHVGDQADSGFWKRFYEEVGPIDVLLDDGGHTNTQMWATLKSALPNVNDGGLIVVEDTHAAYQRKFGNPSRNSLIARMAAVIDAMNYRSSAIDTRDRRARVPQHLSLLSGMNIESLVYSVQFFESIVALRIDREKSVPSTSASFGSKKALRDGKIPEDFRHRGIRESVQDRIRGRIRGLLRRFGH